MSGDKPVTQGMILQWWQVIAATTVVLLSSAALAREIVKREAPWNEDRPTVVAALKRMTCLEQILRAQAAYTLEPTKVRRESLWEALGRPCGGPGIIK